MADGGVDPGRGRIAVSIEQSINRSSVGKGAGVMAPFFMGDEIAARGYNEMEGALANRQCYG